jgi:hypothetical protein
MNSDKRAKNRIPLKLFGGGYLLGDWKEDKAMKQMPKVSKNWSSTEESLVALGFHR